MRHENYKARVSSFLCVGPPANKSRLSGDWWKRWTGNYIEHNKGAPQSQALGVDMKGFQPDSVLGGVGAEPTKASLLPRDNAACSRRMHAQPSWAQRADGKGVGSRFGDWNA
ncbi:hypothetical protein MRX96_007564 [Rhipicephalus microplus]